MGVGNAHPDEGRNDPQAGLLLIQSIFDQIAHRHREDEQVDHFARESRRVLPKGQLEGQQSHSQDRRDPCQPDAQERNVGEFADAFLMASVVRQQSHASGQETDDGRRHDRRQDVGLRREPCACQRRDNETKDLVEGLGERIFKTPTSRLVDGA